MSGGLTFRDGYYLGVYERITWDEGPLLIEGYSYDAYKNDEKLYYYDSQPHPHIPALASTDPHHKHIPPNIKHYPIPAADSLPDKGCYANKGRAE